MDRNILSLLAAIALVGLFLNNPALVSGARGGAKKPNTAKTAGVNSTVSPTTTANNLAKLGEMNETNPSLKSSTHPPTIPPPPPTTTSIQKTTSASSTPTTSTTQPPSTTTATTTTTTPPATTSTPSSTTSTTPSTTTTTRQESTLPAPTEPPPPVVIPPAPVTDYRPPATTTATKPPIVEPPAETEIPPGADDFEPSSGRKSKKSEETDVTAIVIPVVVVLTLIAIGAGAGFYLWHRKKKARREEERAKKRGPVYAGPQPIHAVPMSPGAAVNPIRSGETGCEKKFASGENAPYHMPVSAFKHMGPVKIDMNPTGEQKHILADVPDEEAPSDLEVHFDMENNLVFDIGSEVEERYDGDKLLPKKEPSNSKD